MCSKYIRMESVVYGSEGSLSVLCMMEVMLQYFLINVHKVTTTLACVGLRLD